MLGRQLQELLQVLMLGVLLPNLPLLEQLEEVLALHDLKDLLLGVLALHFLSEENGLEEFGRRHVILQKEEHQHHHCLHGLLVEA